MDCNCTVVLPGPSLAACEGSSLFFFLTILEQFLRTQCDIEDPCGQITPPAILLPEYDFIVVGAGSAGSVVANRLSEVPGWSVLLIEAGVNEPTSTQVPPFFINAQNTSVDWQYITEPETTANLNFGGRNYWPRGKVIGGSSSINGMNYLRGNRLDYDDWEALGNPGWSYEDVLPYFIKSENNLQPELVDPAFHGVGGYLPVSLFPYYFPFEEDVIEAARELGQRIGDFNGDNQLGFNIVQTNSRNGIRMSAARSFLRPVMDRENLQILLNTTVTRVLIDPETRQTLGVEIINQEGNLERILSAREVVLCAGVIGSPQILLHSGVGDEQTLNENNIPVIRDLPGVGRNLLDHVGYQLIFNTNQTNIRDLNWAVATEYLLFRDGPMSNRGESVIGRLQSQFVNQSEKRPDIRLQFGGYRADCSRTGIIGEIEGEIVNGTLPLRTVFMSSTLTLPKSKGYLTIADNNPLTYPKLYPSYLSSPEDIPPIIEGIRFLIRIANTEALQKYGLVLEDTPVPGCEEFTLGSDEYFTCAIRRVTDAGYHQCGTCKMGPDSDPLRVLDPQLRVRGVQGLRVVDASIIPNIVNADLHATVVMIGEKGSDLIKQGNL